MAPPNLQALLKAMLDKGASDLHITAASPPRLRIDNELVRLQTDPLTPVDTKTLCYSVMNDAQKLRFEEDLEIDFSFGIRGLARFRANVYMQQSCVTVADPIEFQHSHNASLVTQREIARDSQSFNRALKYILRQDPDVVLLGE